MQLEDCLSKISIWSILLPLFTGILFYRNLNKDSRIILGIVALATIPQLLRAFIRSGPVLNIAYNFYTICEIGLFFFLFYDKVLHIQRIKVFAVTSIVAFSCNVGLVIWQGLSKRFISELVSLNNIVYTVWILLIILEQYEMDAKDINTRTPFFWYLTGLLLYAPCTLLVYSLWYYIKANPSSVLNKIWIIQYIFNTTMYVLFTVGLLWNGKRKT